MNKSKLLQATALNSIVVVCAVAAFAAPAYAQQTPQDPAQSPLATLPSEQAVPSAQDVDCNSLPAGAQASANCSAIVITGSRIKRPNLESTVPITSIAGQEFFETGRTSVGDSLNDLPALRSTFSQANSTRFLGTAGLNVLDLRGLGTVRTLVLVNGRRHVGGDVLNTGVGVDVNTIPTDLIERVDVVTGGNSAIYGSDAIAGVVNFILKDHFQGLELRGQSGVSKYGDAGAHYLSLLAGQNFADGRGNVAVNLEYNHQSPFYASQRPEFRHRDAFVVVDTDPASAVNGADGTIDRIFYQDLRSATYSNGGTFRAFLGGPFSTPYLFQPDGTLALQTGQRVGRGPNGNFVGGNGDNFLDGTQAGFLPKANRYSANLLAHYEVTPALVPFIEAKFSRSDTLSNFAGPYFTGAVGERFFTDNAYLTSQARGIIRNAYGDYYGAYDASGNPIGDGINDADQFGFGMTKNVVDLGNREETARRDTYRVVAGIKGDFNDTWNYEISANYGALRENTRATGNVNLQRILLAIDAVRDPVSGNIVCRSQLDPSTAAPFVPGNAVSESTLAGDIASCVPINLFGSGNISDAARNYVLHDVIAKGKTSQFVLSAFLGGDTSKFFNLPGGPIGFAVGAEYRAETVLYKQDDLTASGITFYNAIPELNPPASKVKEIYGELRIPILKDLPFAHELTLSGAGRLAHYQGNIGTVKAYNAGLDYAPVQDIRFRGNYSRAVRAPNQVELFTPFGQNYTPAPLDPCASDNIGLGTANRVTNCAAAGIPTSYNFQFTSSYPYLSGGNPGLQAETSDSKTLGVVLQPRFVRGFSASVDYYDITVKSVIAGVTPQTVFDLCYDSSSLSNPYCALFQRAGPTGDPVTGAGPFQIIPNSLHLGPVNYAKLKVRGVDVEINYRTSLGNIGRLDMGLIWTHALQNDQYLDPTAPNDRNQVLLELGDPQDAFNFRSSLQTGRFTFGYKLRYIGKMTPAAIENIISVNGNPPTNADAYPFNYYKPVWYHDVRLGIDVGSHYNFYLGVDNLFNKLPPFGLTGAGGGSAIYSNTGRFMYAGFRAKL